MRAKKKVDLKRLAAALPDFPFAYLITVDDGYRVHTVTVEPTLRGLPEGPDGPHAIVDVGPIGGHTRQNLAHRSEVTLLWPPREPGGYSLIVDGRAEATDSDGDTARFGVVPTRALLHREADSPSAAKGCLHDCVVFTETP
ncbi:MAG: pyridoxamine 5'-phosphate oxidase family protein [Mycobacterium sp.]|nr:pyridoxamine 5'-phosphate oxidase family protein [Mycobacterium sp.]HKI41216.1 pyridoxamine 5'-phosphate oxidase family protein [Mycobacterium sp.]